MAIKPRKLAGKLHGGLTPVEKFDLIYGDLFPGDPRPNWTDEQRRQAWFKHKNALIDEYRYSRCGAWTGACQRPSAFWDFEGPQPKPRGAFDGAKWLYENDMLFDDELSYFKKWVNCSHQFQPGKINKTLIKGVISGYKT